MKPKHLPLFSAAATDLAEGGGASVSAPAVETAPAAADTQSEESPLAGQSAAEPAVKPTLLEQIHASVRSKATLLSENAALKTRAETAEGELTGLRAQLTDLTSQLTALQSERAEITQTLEQAVAANTTIEEKAADIVASTGFEAASLPAGVKAGETKEELTAELSATQDNKRRWEIAEKLNSMN